MKKILPFVLTIFMFRVVITAAGEIVHTGSASDDIIVVVIETADREAVPSQDVREWKVNGVAFEAVGRSSYVWYEERAEGKIYPVTMRHHMYLRMNDKLTDGKIYEIATPYGDVQFAFEDRVTLCESIRVNQAGYFGKSSVRYANFGLYPGDLGPRKLNDLPRYTVIDERTGDALLAGTMTYWGDDSGMAQGNNYGSGEYVYRIDLATLPEGGPYFISVDGMGRSYSFGVGDAFSTNVARVHIRGLYHQRCGIALEKPYTEFTRGTCHERVEITDSEPAGFISTHGPETIVRGGYHDAGDFDRRFGHTLIPAWMLNIFEAYPDRFRDNQYNIPESGNGIPDWLDEALWGMLVWEYLQTDEGGIRGGTEADRHPEYGRVNAETDSLVYRTYRVYGHTTAVGAGLFAQASRLLKPYDSERADMLLRRAENAWRYLNSHELSTAHDAQQMYAALELYLATGSALYHDAFLTHARYLLSGREWPEIYNPSGWNLNHMRDGMIFAPYFFGYLITPRETDIKVREGLYAMLETAADRMLEIIADQPYPIGDAPELAWGTATNQGRYAEPMILMYRLTGDAKYLDSVSQAADYSLGLNPLGKCYVTGLGSNPPHNPLHLDSYFTFKRGIGNVPGLVVYGPKNNPADNYWTEAVTGKVYPEWQTLPVQKRYTEGWSLIGANEFTTWETMALNVCMYGFLGSFYGQK